jgi:hypothetical protein
VTHQAGILAAAGLWALEHNVPKLHTDHANALAFANGINTVDGITVVRSANTNPNYGLHNCTPLSHPDPGSDAACNTAHLKSWMQRGVMCILSLSLSLTHTHTHARSLSLSLSLSLTHTHTLSLSLSLDRALSEP